MPNDRVLAAIVLLILFSSPVAVPGRRDPETGRIRVLYIGDHGPWSPSPILDAEPFISLKVAIAYFHVPAHIRTRMNRLYFPRTYNGLTEYDAIIISDCPVNFFEDRHYHWFKDAVIENGSGFVMIGGNGGFGGRPELPWTPTAVADILPVECVDGGWEGGQVEIVEPGHELIKSLPLDKKWEWMHYYDGNEIYPKQQALVLAELGPTLSGKVLPFWSTWDLGQGRTFAMLGDWTPMGGEYFIRWPYYGDFAVNLMMFLTKNEIPTDIESMHQARSLYMDYRSTRSYVFSVMDFAEKFGANMDPVGLMVIGVDETHDQSISLYIDLDFPNAIEKLEASIDQLLEASEKAMKMKDQVMVWIYLIEWTTVTATFALGVFGVWTLMVRRRLYRDVGTTRLA
ncbi:MAG: hypothetical protein HXS50_00020 [Theionarchaea archaeon]|nr:hypothetical protein [Theionarchaea archaeon]